MVQLNYRQLQPAPPVTSKRYYDASSPGSSLNIRSSIISRDAVVPSGIVASRLFVLQKPGAGKTDVLPEPPQLPASLVEHDRDSTQTGFGRRVNSRFGQPAVQNFKPDEETPGPSSHAFVGLNTNRRNHNEHHAHVQPQLRGVRSSTQMQLLAQSQTHVPNNKGLLKSRSQEPMRQEYNSLDTQVLEEIEPSGNKRDILAQTAIFPVKDTVGQPKVSGAKGKERRMRTETSETSFVTTSSIRRQSVRELFNDYGIDRPAGLISKHTFRDMGNTVRLEKSSTKCHLCGWNNTSVYASCWICGHNACSKCEDKPGLLSQSALKHNDNYSKKLVEPSKPEAMLRTQKTLGKHEPIKVKTLAVSRVARYSDGGISNPSVSSKSTYTEQIIPRAPVHSEPVTTQGQGSYIPLLSEARTSTKIKESPFVVADSQAVKSSIGHTRTSLSRRLLLSEDRRRAPHQLSKEFQDNYSSSENEKESGSPQKRFVGKTQNGMVSLLAQNIRDHEETDKGYAADTSVFGGSAGMDNARSIPDHQLRITPRSKRSVRSSNTTLVDESSPTRSKRFERLLEYTAKSDSVTPPTPIKRPHSSQLWQHLSTFDKQVPEFVECRGYPRTGHHRHDVSVAEAGTVGECQHCLDDCSCAACQKADHSVRCCTHPAHQALVHIHHTPQRNPLPKDLIEFTRSLSKVSQPDSAPISPRSSMTSPLIQQRTRDLLQKAIKMTPTVKKTAETYQLSSAVEAVLKVGKSKPSVGPGTSALFTHLDMFSRPSRKCMSDSDLNINSMSYLPADSTPKYTVKSRTQSSITEITAKLALAGVEVRPKGESQAAKEIFGDAYAMVELGTQENGQPAASSRTLLPALTSGRIISKAAADKKAKLKQIQKFERNMTPVDGNSDVAPRTLMYGRRGPSSIQMSGESEVRSCDGTSHIGEHQCLWKKRYIESLADKSHKRQNGDEELADMNISGVTVVLHLEGREDLVIKAESWKGGKVSLDGRA